MNEFDAMRRRLIAAATLLTAIPKAVFAQQCRVTPRDSLGPFYKPGAPRTTELCAGGSGGERLVVTGRVLGMPDCTPLAGARIEVWQADVRGEYTLVTPGRKEDPDCLLRATVTTDREGRYRFITILPGEYPGRPRHIHYRVTHQGYATLVTQLYFDRERGVRPELLGSMTRDDKGVLQVSFDVILARA